MKTPIFYSAIATAAVLFFAGTASDALALNATTVAATNITQTSAMLRGPLDPSFSPEITNNTASVSNSVTNITVTPTSEDTNATILVRATTNAFSVVASDT